MNKFWRWENRIVADHETQTEMSERTLFLDGIIAEESWFDDDVTPKMFKNELTNGTGNITVYINSVGGDCIAAAQIYNMLADYKGKVTVKIDGIAASAASVIAMAGDAVLMSPVSVMMIHNPATAAFGDHTDMQKAIDMLNEVKESIINAYALKTGQSRVKLSHMMESETWMNAYKAVELGFADDIIKNSSENDSVTNESTVLFSCKAVNNALLNKMSAKYGNPKVDTAKQAEIQPQADNERSADKIVERLNYIKKYI